MAVRMTRSWKNYKSLCRIMEKNSIEYICDDNELSVRCTLNGRDADHSFIFEIDSARMLITLASPLELSVPEKKNADLAIAVCMINNTLKDGCFGIDFNEHTIYFTLTSSFYESDINGRLFEYMLSAAADTVDEYYPKLQKLMKCAAPVQDDNTMPLTLLSDIIYE